MKFRPMNKNLITIFGGLILVSVFLSLTLNNTNLVLAYSDNTTHPDLTREIIDFYELSGGKKLTDEQKQWIIQGSIDEDAAPRWLNHFYDPVFDRGLDTPMLFVNGYSSKNWGLYSKYQLAKLGKTGTTGVIIAGKSDPSSLPFVFSYEAGLERYARNKEKDAYLTLGHILHLIEDLTVPEHTRNDPHPGGKDSSFYEDWTKNNSAGLTQNLGKRLFVKGNKPIIYADLETYFNNLATYTNNHFFSPDTINSDIYIKPKIVFEDGTFAYGKDENGEYFDLAYIEEDFTTKNTVYNIKKEQILQEYWLRLSRQAVINGAGVIQLFLNQAEAARQSEMAKGKQSQPKISLISQILNFFRSPSAPKNEPALVITSEPTKPLPKIVKSETVAKPAAPAKSNPAGSPTSKPAEVGFPPTKTTTSTPTLAPQNQAPQSGAPMVYGGGGGGGGSSSNSNTQQTTPVVVAQGDTTGQANNTQQDNSTSNNATTTESLNVQINAGDLIINEIMYDLEGSDTLNNKNREWVEIYNNSGREITLTGGSGGWRFNDGSNHLLNEPPAQGSMTIPVGGYVILAGDAPTFLVDHSGFGGTVIDTVMILKNTSATLKISAPDGVIIDEVTYNSSWGAKGDGKTLERKSAGDWGVSSANGGTPGALNNWLLTSDIDGNASTTLGLGTDVSATTTISENTTWTLASSPYRLFFDGQRRPTVAAGAILTIEPGVKIIPQSGGATVMEIQGTLNAAGTAVAPIIFTSIADADDSASTTPQKGDWLNIFFSQGSQANLDYVAFRYGGQGNTLPLQEMVNIVGAAVNIKNSKFENSQNTALHLMDSIGTIENSIFSDNNCGISVDSLNGIAQTSYGGCYGIHTTGQILSAAPQIRNNQFIRNQLIGIEVRSGTVPTIDNNIFTDNGYPIKIESSYPVITNSQLANSTTSVDFLGGIAISGYTHFSQNYTLKNNPQLPYILETNGPALSPYVDAGAILTIEPGTIFKIGHTFTALNINGGLVASTTPNSPIVFTSLKDDSKDGDTNGDGAASSPQNNDWANIKFFAGSIGNFVNTIFSYGGFGYIAPPPLPSVLLIDFPTATLSWDNSEINSSVWTADKSGAFEKVVFHNFSMSNPNSLSSLAGIKKASDNNFIVSTTTVNLKDITTMVDVGISLSGSFTIGEGYYATLQVIPPAGTTTLTALDLFNIGKDASQKAAVAFYELVLGLPANPAISIDAGATVVVQ